MSLADIQSVQAKNLAQSNLKTNMQIVEQNRCMQDSLLSQYKSKVGFDDTASTIFTENWSNLSAWTTAATPGVQVSGNKLYPTGSGGGNSGANHAYQLSSNENMRAVFNVNVDTSASSGGVIVGVSKDVAGAIPAVGGGNAFGFYFSSSLSIMDSGSTSAPLETSSYTTGSYIVTVTVDETYISLSVVKSDGSIEASARKLRSSFQVNNIYVFNSDTRGLTGFSIGACSVRKGLQTITPRTNIEGITKTIQWTGDGTQSFRVYLPKGYDSRIPSPVAICFHGNGTDETQWSINANMKTMQQALVNAGYIVLTCSLNASKTTWGNTATTNAYFKAYQFLKNHYAISSVVIYANSMGGIESLNALSENNIPCNAWVGTAPTYSLINNYQNSLFTSIITSAYGIAGDGSDYATKTKGRDPSLMNPLAFRGVPMMILAAPDDASVSKSANADQLALAVQNTSNELVKVDVPSGGHSFAVDPYVTQIINFFNKYSSF